MISTAYAPGAALAAKARLTTSAMPMNRSTSSGASKPYAIFTIDAPNVLKDVESEIINRWCLIYSPPNDGGGVVLCVDELLQERASST